MKKGKYKKLKAGGALGVFLAATLSLLALLGITTWQVVIYFAIGWFAAIPAAAFVGLIVFATIATFLDITKDFTRAMADKIYTAKENKHNASQAITEKVKSIIKLKNYIELKESSLQQKIFSNQNLNQSDLYEANLQIKLYNDLAVTYNKQASDLLSIAQTAKNKKAINLMLKKFNLSKNELAKKQIIPQLLTPPQTPVDFKVNTGNTNLTQPTNTYLKNSNQNVINQTQKELDKQ